MAVVAGTLQVAYATTTATISITGVTPSAGVAVAHVTHNQTGITNTGVSSSVDGAFTSSGTRAANGKCVTVWQLQSLSNALTDFSATFDDTWGSSVGLLVQPATGAHASAAFGGYNTATGNSTTPSCTSADFTAGDLVVDCVIGTDDGTISTTGNNVETSEDTSSLPIFSSTNDTDGVMPWSAQFGTTWAQAVIGIRQAAAAGTNPKGPLGNPFFGPFGGPI